MKQSQYNHYIPLEDGNVILYNVMSGAILLLDSDAKRLLDNLEGASTGELMHFRKNGVIVDSEENELLKFRDKYNLMHYHPENLLFVLTPTSRCNLFCEYCWQRTDDSLVGKSDQTVTMSEPTVEGVLTFLKGMTEALHTHHLSIMLYGGEPLMAREVSFQILRDLSHWSEERSLPFLTSFYTNGTLVDPAFINDIKEYTINMIRTTLDGPQAIHDSYRHYKNGKGTYEQIVTAIGMLLDAEIPVSVQINLNRHYTHLPELFDDLNERGLKKITILPRPVYDPLVMLQDAQKLYGFLPEDFPVAESNFSVPIGEIPRIKLLVSYWAYQRGFNLAPPHLGSLPCLGASYHFYVVDPYGDVYKCVASMLIKNMRVGHISEDGHFERYPFFYEWANNDPTYVEKCQSCSWLPSCQGGCLHGRTLLQIPCVCEVSAFEGEEYIKMYLKQKYAEKLEALTVNVE